MNAYFEQNAQSQSQNSKSTRLTVNKKSVETLFELCKKKDTPGLLP